MATRKTESGEGGVSPAAKAKSGRGGKGGAADAAPETRAADGQTGTGTGGGRARAAGAAGTGTTVTGTAQAGTGSSGRTGGGQARSRAGAAGDGSSGGRAKATGPNLQKDLREFAAGRPQGWSHDDWLRFLEHLESRGHNINDREMIGSMLEKERIAVVLDGVSGLGPQRVRTIAERFGTLWSLRQASAEQISREAKLPQPLAERVVEAARG